MKNKTIFKILLLISIAGLSFSGYLSYTELFADFCAAAELGMGSCTEVASLPACVYGFIMYLAIFTLSILGIRNKE